MPPEFVGGIDLARAFYAEAVAPILARSFPGLTHSAGLIGSGSEVLGFDSARSTDHHWGPRVMLFAADDDVARVGSDVYSTLAQQLPPTFRGYPTNFGEPDAVGTRLLQPVTGPPIAHRVELRGIDAFLRSTLGFDPRAGMETTDWLCVPSQVLLELTSGEIFHDGLGALGRIRAALEWYPDDVWRYLIACQWQRIAEEEPFVGRCDEAGDELGARIVAARLARDLMRLCFLFERRYAPYSKWLGTAFGDLACAAELTPLLDTALSASGAAARAGALVAACEAAGRVHNALGITAPVDPTSRRFHDRPYLVLGAERFSRATLATIDPRILAALPGDAGGIDQWVDSTPVLSRGLAWHVARTTLSAWKSAHFDRTSRPVASSQKARG